MINSDKSLKAVIATMLLGALSDETLRSAHQDGYADSAVVNGALIYADAIVAKARVPVESLKKDAMPACAYQYPVSEIAVSARVATAFHAHSITHLGQFTLLTRQEVLGWSHVGRKCTNEIEELLFSRGLAFKAPD